MNEEIVKEEFKKKNDVQSIMNSDMKENSNEEGKEKSQREIGIMRTKSKRKITIRPRTTYAQCFSGGNFATQYEDECPVNYSLKYSETESCKCINKCETMKKKLKDYTDYAETDLDQPTDFSLKYAEKTYDDENKNIAFNYYNNHKVKFKEYADYVETDLDQPTDFTLKYRESAEEDIKNVDFAFYENEERKPSNAFATRTVPEELPCERLPGRFASQDETPLMFSRSSSLNSLSSFVHITQSIPDDRSSVVSDFSRMTSGIISPSELPDSPTQTAPSSPKRVKPPVTFPSKPDFIAKQSVFEDDVATYKQEDTPIEFSRATSLSSLNIENPLKPELVIKQTLGPAIHMSKEESQNGEELVHTEHLKQDLVPEKMDQEKGKFELASVLEVDESLFSDCINIDIQINCRKPKPSSGRLMVANEGAAPFRQSNGFHPKPNCRLRYHNENRKPYAPPYELSDDAVHTYHTEGTPANVSHAGSHSDLSALSIASGIPLSGADDNSDSECFCPEGKADPLRGKMKVCDGSEAVGRSNGSSKGVSLEYPRKDQASGKDEAESYAIENGSCNFLGSSLGDLTVDVMNPSLDITRAENFEEAPSQILSPLRNVSPQSPNSIVFEEADDAEKGSEEFENEFGSSEAGKEESDTWDQPNGPEQTEQTSEDITAICSTAEFPTSANIDLDSNLPLTAFEEALLEECIRLGMPRKRRQKQLQETHLKLNGEGEEEEALPVVPGRRSNAVGDSFAGKTPEEGELGYPKPSSKEGKWWSGKNCPEVRFAGCESQVLCAGASTPNSVHGDHFDFDSSEPLTPFEEVLLEQCIQLGMPQRKETHMKHLDEGTGDFDCDFAGLITPLESALVEQCIQLGMPQKKGQKRENSFAGGGGDESHKAVSCLAVHLNRLRLSTDSEKDKDSAKKCESCPCGRRHAYRRRNTGCRRTKSKSDHFKVESCPV